MLKNVMKESGKWKKGLHTKENQFSSFLLVLSITSYTYTYILLEISFSYYIQRVRFLPVRRREIKRFFNDTIIWFYRFLLNNEMRALQMEFRREIIIIIFSLQFRFSLKWYCMIIKENVIVAHFQSLPL